MLIYALLVRLPTGAGNVAYCTFPVTEALPVMVNVANKEFKRLFR